LLLLLSTKSRISLVHEPLISFKTLNYVVASILREVVDREVESLRNTTGQPTAYRLRASTAKRTRKECGVDADATSKLAKAQASLREQSTELLVNGMITSRTATRPGLTRLHHKSIRP